MGHSNTKFFSTLVFDDATMKDRLDDQTFQQIQIIRKKGGDLSLETANKFAAALKDWALEKGATHYTHWFQPLNGTTSEKHDSFLIPVDDEGHAIFSFSGKDLVQGEPDASSFPSGGLRATFEARGYTAWDTSSNAFIKDEVLCIPTAFCSYNGFALDKKTPLLRSMDALKKEIKNFCSFFGAIPNEVVINVGGEQEFFLIPEDHFAHREDLVMCGRTLFGNDPCKGQELEEHYFGSIRPTVNEFLKDLDGEAWNLGIALHTKHNEAAPTQHEVAPIYTNANRAIDENLLLMEKMKILASRRGLTCLLHEKPFNGINGSGKHCNWSIAADGENLLNPGDKPQDNIRFMALLACVIRAVDEYQGLLRTAAASAGNDCRLGAAEAPPAIVSMYLGDDLETVVDAVANGDTANIEIDKTMDLGANVIPNFHRDTSDRNRTSPFAFTGNKFEYRMPGSQDNLSDSVMVLNTAIASAVSEFNILVKNALKNLEKSQLDKRQYIYAEIMNIVTKFFSAHRRIVYSGNGYSKQWKKEAEQRGLVNLPTTADALPYWIKDKTKELFCRFNILNDAELNSRYIAYLEKYNKLINIEANVMHRMTMRTYIPAISQYAADVASQIENIKKVNPESDLSHQNKLLQSLVDGLNVINDNLQIVTKFKDEVLEICDEQRKADFNAHHFVPAMKKLRKSVDDMEHITSRDYWPVSSYNNMLFYV